MTPKPAFSGSTAGIEIRNLPRLMGKLRQRERDAGGRFAADPKVSVGYTAPYAIWVHEIRTNHHPVGRAGFLLDVAREMSSQLGRIIVRGMQAGKGLLRSCVEAATALMLESQRNCPVDTGFLRSTAYVKVEQ